MYRSRVGSWLCTLAERHSVSTALGIDLAELVPSVGSPWRSVSGFFNRTHQQPTSQVLFTRGVAKQPLRNDPYTTPPTNPVQLLQRIKLSRSIGRLQSVLKQNRAKLEPIHVSAAVTNLPAVVKRAADEDRRLKEHDWTLGGNLLAALTDLAAPLIPQYQARELANNLWALGQVKKTYPIAVCQLQHALVQELAAERYSKMFSGTNAIDVVQMVSGAERLGIKDPNFWSALHRVATRRAQEDDRMTAANVATLAAAFAKSGHASTELFAALAVRGRKVAAYFRPPTASSTLAAFVKANAAVSNPEFMIDLLEAIQDQLRTCRTEHLAQVVYASATLKLQLAASGCPALPDAKELHHVGEACSQQLSSTAGAQEDIAASTMPSSAAAAPPADVATRGASSLHQQLSAAISCLPPKVAAQSIGKLEKFSSNALAEMLLGLARLRYHDQSLMDAVAMGIAREERLYADRRVMVGIIQAFAMLQHKTGGTDAMLQRLCGVLKRGTEGMQPSLSLRLVKHLAELRHRDELLLQRIAESAMRWGVQPQVELLEAMRKQQYISGRKLLIEAVVQGLQTGGIEKPISGLGYVMAELAQQGWKEDIGLYAALGGRVLTEGKGAHAGVVVLRTFGNLQHWTPAALMREAEAHIDNHLKHLPGYWLVQAVKALSAWPDRNEQVFAKVLSAAVEAVPECQQDDLLLLLSAARMVGQADDSFINILRHTATTKQYRRLLTSL